MDREDTTILTKEDLEDILDKIENEYITVGFMEWVFTGGNTMGNWHSYTLSEGDIKGVIHLHTDPDDRIKLFYQDGVFETEDYEDNKELYKKADSIILKALARDDKEIIDKMTDNNGKIHLPQDFNDITRNDILEGRYVIDKNNGEYVNQEELEYEMG